MSDLTGFRWVEIEAFRGFNERQRIDLDASAVIILGPNGTGKTSLFDAMQWLLLGSLERLERFRVHKNDEQLLLPLRRQPVLPASRKRTASFSIAPQRGR